MGSAVSNKWKSIDCPMYGGSFVAHNVAVVDNEFSSLDGGMGARGCAGSYYNRYVDVAQKSYA